MEREYRNGLYEITSRVEMTPGADTLTITGSTVLLSGNNGDIYMKAGDDTVAISGSTVIGGAQANFYLGQGADELEITNSAIAVNLNGNDGDDTVRITGNTEGKVTIVSGKTIFLDDGNDTFQISAALINKGAIAAGRGNDVLIIDQESLTGSGRIDMGYGNDAITVTSGSLAGAAYIDMGDGDDKVSVTASLLDKVYISGGTLNFGDGNDTLELRGGTLGAFKAVNGLENLIAAGGVIAQNLTLAGETTSLTLDGSISGAGSTIPVITFGTAAARTDAALIVTDDVICKVGLAVVGTGSTLSIVNEYEPVLTFSGNTGTAFSADQAIVTLDYVRWSGNSIGLYGNTARLDISNANFSGNSIGAYISGGTANFTNVSFSDNKSYGLQLSYTDFTGENLAFVNSESKIGGGMKVLRSSVVLENATFRNTYGSRVADAAAPTSAGALFIYGGTFSGKDLVFENALACNYGGAITITDTNSDASTSVKTVVTLDNPVFTGNTVEGKNVRGGAIYVDGGTITLNDAVFTGNVANDTQGNNTLFGRGGAIYLDDAYLVYNVTEDITNAGNISKRTFGSRSWKQASGDGGFLYGTSKSTVNFKIDAEKTLTIGDENGDDSIDGYCTIILDGGEDSSMVVNGAVGSGLNWVINSGTLNLASISRTIDLGKFDVAEEAELILSNEDDTINLNESIEFTGSLDFGGFIEEGETINLNGNTLSGVALEAETLTINGGSAGVLLSDLNTRKDAILDLTLNENVEVGNITGGDDDDVITINEKVKAGGIINLGLGSNTINLNGTLKADEELNFTFDGGTTTIIVNYGADIEVSGGTTAARAITVDFSDSAAKLKTTVLDATRIGEKGRIIISKGRNTGDFFVVELYNEPDTFTVTTDSSNAIFLQTQGQDGWRGIEGVQGDIEGNGLADILMTNGNAGAWLVQTDQTVAWRDLSSSSGCVLLGTGRVESGKTTSDIYLKTDDNYVGVWVTDLEGKVAGWKTIDSFDDDTEVLGLGDFNADGETDLLLRNVNGAVGCYFTNGSVIGWNYFQSLGDEWEICAIGDLNGDGRSDIVLKNNDAGYCGSWLTQEDGTVEWADLDTLADGFEVVGCGDFNGDGIDDVLLRSGNYYGAWLVKDGNAKKWMGLGTFRAEVENIADYNGDGLDDLRVRTSKGDIGVELVIGTDDLEWKYYGSVGSEWDTSLASLK